MSLLGILTGATNHARSFVYPNEPIEALYLSRKKICNSCLIEKGVPESLHCPVCECPLSWRLRQTHVGCPEEKW